MPLATNFRRDLAGKVYQLSQFSALQPVADKNFDVAKMNERFIKLHNAVRTCFDAIADIASRDTSFLPSFFQGFVNPVYVKSTAYADKTLYKFINGFNSNGTSKTFAEERIVYSYPDIGDITTEDYEYMLFKNGELMDSSLYTVDNSAFGIKAYVKSTSVANNDTITLAVHRVFNRTYQMWKSVLSAAATSLDQIIDVPTYFPNFYDVRYLRLAVRSSSNAYYDVIDPSKYSVVYDNANQKIRLVASGLSLAKFDTVILFDCTSYWKTTLTGVGNGGAIPSVPLTQTITSGENVPVGVMFYRDLDVWLNGRHLIPGKHFVVSPSFQGGSSTASQWYIDFLMTLPSGTGYRLDIMKNVPYVPGECVYSAKDVLDSKGVEYVDGGNYPVLNGMGEMYINGRFIDPKNISAAHKNVLVVNNVNETKDFFYKMVPPITTTTSNMLSDYMSRVTELDQIVSALGGVGELIARIKLERSDIVDAGKTTIDKSVNGSFIDVSAVVASDIANYVMALAAAASSDYVLDANATVASQFGDGGWDISILTSDAIIDCNPDIGTAVNFDAN